MSVFFPTSPSPGQGWVWNVGTGRWDPPSGTAQPPPPSSTSQPTSTVIPGAPGTTANDGSGLSNGTQTGVITDSAGNPANLTPIEKDAADAKAAYDRYFGPQAAGQDAASARQDRDTLRNDYNASQPRAAPQAAAPGAIPVAQAGTAQVGAAAPIVAPTVGSAVTAQSGPTVQAGKVQAGEIGPIERYGASRVNTTPGATAGQVLAPGIDKTEQSQFRAGEVDLVKQLQDAAAGKVPSAAELQGKRQAEEAMQAQLSLAGAVHGRGAGAAIRNAGRNVAQLQGKAAGDAALLRATEQEKARGQLGNALGQARGADISLATKGAEMGLAANTTTAQLGTQVSISNADRLAAAAMKDAELEQAANAGNAAAQNEKARRQAELTTSANTTSEQLAVEAAKANQGAQTTTNLANAAAENRMRELQAQITSQNGIATAEQQNELTKLQAQISNQVNLANAHEINVGAIAGADNATKVSLENLNAQLRSRELDDHQKTELMRAWLQANQQVLGMDAAWNAVSHGDDFTWRDGVAIANGVLEGGAKAATAIAASDRRVKKDVVKVSDDAAQRLADALGSPSEWTYTGKHDDGHRHVGWMAQDLEKDPLGAKFVRTGDDGTKAVDYQGLTAALLAAALRSKKGRR